ncbi:MAG TPA: tetratricopeptide repeat protein, partial [Ktedonobacteraceae bacterium]|nr:tetratricopeptide repeat protein [Ktedonobacteraceae bacterium]
ATTLSNLAGVYGGIEQPKRALELYEEALPIMREVGDRAGEAVILSNLAVLYQGEQRYTEALDTFEVSIHLAQEVVSPTTEIASWVGRAMLLFEHLGRREAALSSLDRALELFRTHGLSHDAAGQTPEAVEWVRERLLQGESLTVPQSRSLLPVAILQQLIENTRAVLSSMPGRKAGWKEQIRQLLASATSRGETGQTEVELFTVLLALLDGKEALLPPEHPYAFVLEAIQQDQELETSDVFPVSKEALEAIREFLTADDWPAAQWVVEAYQDLLFRPEVADFFRHYIAHAKSQGEERLSSVLEEHLTILLVHCGRNPSGVK